MKTKIFRSPYSNYYDDEIANSLKIYADDYLKQLSNEGFTAIWMRAVLRDISKNNVITEYGSSAQKSQNILNELLSDAQTME